MAGFAALRGGVTVHSLAGTGAGTPNWGCQAAGTQRLSDSLCCQIKQWNSLACSILDTES